MPLAPPVINATLPATSRIKSLHRQFRRSVTDGRHPRFGFAASLEVLDVLEHRSEQCVCLQQSQHSADAGVYSVSPTEMCAMVASDIEAIRVLPLARVAVGGGEHESAALSLWDHDACELDIAHGDTSRHPGRRVPP